MPSLSTSSRPSTLSSLSYCLYLSYLSYLSHYLSDPSHHLSTPLSCLVSSRLVSPKHTIHAKSVKPSGHHGTKYDVLLCVFMCSVPIGVSAANMHAMSRACAMGGGITSAVLSPGAPRGLRSTCQHERDVGQRCAWIVQSITHSRACANIARAASTWARDGAGLCSVRFACQVQDTVCCHGQVGAAAKPTRNVQ